MTLFVGSLDIDTASFAVTGASRWAPDREREPRNKALAPWGEFCLRCGGLLVASYMASLESDLTDRPMRVWRCVNCGDCVDSYILANRRKGPELGRPRDRGQGLNTRDGRAERAQA